MMRYRTPVFLTVLTFITLSCLFFKCANPLDEEPLRWKTITELPVTNNSFVIADEFDNIFDIDSIDLIYASQKYNDEYIAQLEPDSIKGDTLEFSIFKNDTSEFEIHEDKLDDKTFSVSLGAIAITNAPDLVQNINTNSLSGNISVSTQVTFEKVYQVTFSDTLSNIMQISVSNLSSTAISNFTFVMEGIGSGSAESVAAGQTLLIQLPVSGKTLKNKEQISITGTTGSDGPIQMQISTSVNGLYASSLSVDDHLVSLVREYVNPYEITDTLNIDYVDIKDGFFVYEVTNHTGIELRIRGIHEHLWKSSFAERSSFSRYEQLKNISHIDSLENHSGYIINGEMIVPPRREQLFIQKNISQTRLFAEWDTLLQKSITRVRYIVSNGNPSGDTINLHSNDMLIFTIRSDFKYNKLSGTVVKPYKTVSDTEKVVINIPWGESAADSLRGKFVLQNVYSDVRFKTITSQNSFIDSVDFTLDIFVPAFPGVKSSAITQFTNVENNSRHRCLIDITDVINLYPDTVYMVTTMSIPQGARIVSVNDLQVSDEDYNEYTGKMKIGVLADYRLNARLDWKVVNTVNLDLEGKKFPVYEALRYIKKLDQRSVDFELKIKNSSNLNMILYALVAPEHLIDSLEYMPANEAFSIMVQDGEAKNRGLVNFLGSQGLKIPSRSVDSVFADTIHWDHQQLETILSSDTCSWRWFLQIQEQDRDALNDTDFIKIESWIHIDGINNADSLIIW